MELLADLAKGYMLVGCATGALYTSVATLEQRSWIGLLFCLFAPPVVLYHVAANLWRGGPG